MLINAHLFAFEAFLPLELMPHEPPHGRLLVLWVRGRMTLGVHALSGE